MSRFQARMGANSLGTASFAQSAGNRDRVLRAIAVRAVASGQALHRSGDRVGPVRGLIIGVGISAVIWAGIAGLVAALL